MRVKRIVQGGRCGLDFHASAGNFDRLRCDTQFHLGVRHVVLVGDYAHIFLHETLEALGLHADLVDSRDQTGQRISAR